MSPHTDAGEAKRTVSTYSRDIRRNSSGGDDYPWDIMCGVADALDEILNYKGGAESPLHDEYVMDRAKAAHAAAQSAPVAQASPDYFEVAGKLGAALVQIAEMDPKECRADDLGRAARIAREALAPSVPSASRGTEA